MSISFAAPLCRSARVPRLLSVVFIVLLALILMGLPELCLAQTGGLAKSTSTMEKLRDWLWLIIPIVCLIAGGLLGAAYSMDLIRKDTLYTWVGGVIFTGLVAGGIIELVF